MPAKKKANTEAREQVVKHEKVTAKIPSPRISEKPSKKIKKSKPKPKTTAKAKKQKETDKKVKGPQKKTQREKSKAGPSAEEKKAEQARQREQALQGNLLQQMIMLDQRINTMDREKERYCLLEMKQDKKGTSFLMAKDEDPKKFVLKVDLKGRMSCSCLDWRIRCRKMAIACKHIYYLLIRILTYELFDYYDNTIQNMTLFQELVKRRIRLNEFDYKLKQGDQFLDEQCPICFSDFKIEDENNLLKCPDCQNFVHRECMKVWLSNSRRRNCVLCKSESWVTFFR